MVEESLVAAVARERECTAEVLRLLREVERQKLYLARGYSSLFAYCTGFLRYSEPEAQIRISAMRLPGAIARIEQGKLSMSVAAQVQSAVRREALDPARTKELLNELSGASKREAEKKLAALFPQEAKPEKTKPISEDLLEIRMTVSREEAEIIERLLDRKSHTNFERSKAKLFVELATAALQKLEGKQGEVTLPHGPGKGRYIPASTRRYVWKRDQGECQFPGCRSRHGLQLDHVIEYAKGGTHAPENLRLYCGVHNRTRN
jgi:5-methylcytosine-specific restriction endonuclease McrA